MACSKSGWDGKNGRQESDSCLPPVWDGALLEVAGVLLATLGPLVFALELFDPARRVDVFHLASKEGMARRTDFHGDGLTRAPRREFVAATAGHGRFDVFGMDARLH